MSRAQLYRATIFHTRANPFRDTDALESHDDGGLLVRDGRIAACGDFSVVRRDAADAEVIDRRGGVLLPGFIDAHVHFPQLRIVGRLGLSLMDWLEQAALPEEARMADAAYAADTARRFVGALASHGTTTALVFGSHFAPATAALFDAAEAAGLRVISGLVFSDRLVPPTLQQTPAGAHRDSVDLIRRYHGRGRLLYAVTPRFAPSTTDAMLEVCQSLLREHDTLRVTSHINEHDDEIQRVRRLFPSAHDYFAVYERYGLTGPRCVLAHNVHSTRGEIERLAATRTSIAHCPSSNAALGSGIFPMRRHVDGGVHFALGTDVGAGTGFSMMREALQAHLMQRVSPDAITLDPARMLYLATLAGAQALGLGDVTGSFCAGKSADFVYVRPATDSVLDVVLRHASGADAVLAALFTLADAESVRETRVAGDVVFQA